jgi:hypothetical protein
MSIPVTVSESGASFLLAEQFRFRLGSGVTPLTPLASVCIAFASLPAVAGCRLTESDIPTSAGIIRPDKKPAIPQRGSPEWKRLVSRRLGVTDKAGHGPHIGSGEWLSAVDRKSGVSDAHGHGPDLGSEEWQRAVDFKVFGRR